MVAPFFLKRRTVRTIKKIFNTTVSVKEGASRSVLRGIVQYDTLNEVNIRLTDGSKVFDYYGYTNIVFKVLKADGTSYVDSEGENVIATNPEGGIVTVILKGQATTAVGLCQSVIEIYNGAEKMTTARLNYEVFEALGTAEETDSESQYPVFQNLMNDLSALEASIEEAEAQRVAAENARAEAEAQRANEASGYVAKAHSSAAEAAEWARQAKAIAGGNFAPDGYGLGVGAVMLTATDDLNNVWRNGFYYWNAKPINAPFGYGVMLVTSVNSTALVQEITSYNTIVSLSGYGNSKLRRVRLGDAVIEEWENPQMSLGVEYRTTERYNGKPVYTKFASLGAIAKDSCVAIKYSDDENCRAISVCGGAPNAATMQTGVFSTVVDGVVKNPENRLELGGYMNHVIVKANFSLSNAVAIVKYYKTTD